MPHKVRFQQAAPGEIPLEAEETVFEEPVEEPEVEEEEEPEPEPEPRKASGRNISGLKPAKPGENRFINTSGPTQFKPGGKPPKVNQSKLLRNAIFRAMAQVGEDGNGKGGVTGWMKQLALTDPKVFAQIVAKHFSSTGSDDNSSSKPEPVTRRIAADGLGNLSTEQLADLYRQTVASPDATDGKPNGTSH